MSILNLRLPDSLHDQVRELARRDGVSINQFITLAVSEKIATLMTLDYVKERAQRASRERFAEALQKIAAAGHDPLPEDELPEDLRWLKTAEVDEILAEVLAVNN